MLRTISRIAVFAVAVSTIVAAQAKPEFAGRWTTDPDPAAAAAPPGGVPGGGAGGGGQRAGGGPGGGGGGGVGRGRGDMGSGWGSTITITQDAARLTVEYAFFARGDMQPPLRFAYALDGSETKNSVMMGQGMQTQTSKTAWDGASLVITTIHTFTDPATGKPTPFEVKQKLTLESPPQREGNTVPPASLVVETTRAGVLGGSATTTKTVYRKF